MGARQLSTEDDFIRANTRPLRHPLVPEIVLHLADAITPIWQASEDSLTAGGVEPPFWAFAWPGGAATARHILDHPEPLRGRDVLDLAAGSGIAAIAAAMACAAAAKVTAAEIDPLARAAIALNARANNVAVTVAGGDPLDTPPPADTLILAGDVCYERKMAERVMAWLHAATRAGAEVWLADPGRNYLPKTGLVEMARIKVPTSLELEDREMRETALYRLTD